jgi:site-specific recombinase XerD
LEERFINELMMNLSRSFSINDLNIIKTEIVKMLDTYQVSQRKQLPASIDDIPNIYKTFIVSKKIAGLSDGSLKLYNHILSKFFFEIVKPLKDISTNDIRLYMYNKTRDGASKSYLSNIRAILSSFFTWCYKEEYIDKNPMDNIDPIKFNNKQVKPLTEKQIEQCREICSTMNLRNQVIFEFFYFTGCRAFEAADLKKESINFEDNTVLLYGKGDKYRTVPFTERLALLLNKYFDSREDNSEYVFVSLKKPYNKLTVDAMECIFKNIGNKAGIHLHPHKMRHTVATILLDKGMPMEEVQKFLGHSSADTTAIYAEVNSNNMIANYKKCLA